MTELDERWVPIPGWEGLYEVSDQGRVRSLDRVVPRRDGRSCSLKGRFMTLRPNSRDGYVFVRLAIWPKKRAYRLVHRLVLLAFVGPRPEGLQTRHLDGDKTNNRLVNLRYGTPRENQQDRRRHGTAFQTHCWRGHEFTPENSKPNGSGRRTCRVCANERRRRNWVPRAERAA